MGPWRHSQANYDGSTLGPLKWEGDTALQFRRDVLKPFFDQYLKDGAPKADTPPVFIYNTGENRWDRLHVLAARLRVGLRGRVEAALSQPAFGLSFQAPGRRRGPERASTSTSPIRPSRCRTCRGRCGSPTATPGGSGWSPISASSPTAPTCSATSTPRADRARAGSAAHRS